MNLNQFQYKLPFSYLHACFSNYVFYDFSKILCSLGFRFPPQLIFACSSQSDIF